MIRFSCPSCRATLSVSDSHAGKKIKCSKCQQIADAPQQASEEAIQAIPAQAASMQAIPVLPLEAPEPSFSCPYCHASSRPVVETELSQAGLVVMIVLLVGICTLPFFWIPLITMRQEFRKCSRCGIRLG